MDGSVPMQEYMRHMNLSTWILTHLKNETIYGLRYMKPEGISGICFEFPWKRIGDQDWKQHWEILLKYAEHRGFPLPTNLDNDKPKLTDIKNKFRNEIDKSQEFEKLGCRNGYQMYRLKSEAQPPAKRKRIFDDYNNAAASSSPDVNFTIADEDLECLLSGMGDVSNDATSTFNNIAPLRKIEEIMQTTHISDDEMAVFSISVGQGNQLTTDLINLKDGIQIIFTRNVNNIIREHDSVVGQLLDDVVGDNIKRYSYDGNDVKVKKILKCSYGGIILKYEHRALHIWRLCQARVFVESHFHQQKRKVERCCKDSGIQRLSTFSYQKFITEVQKNPTIDVKDSTRITIGTSDLYLDVYPECTRRLKVALKQPAGGASDEAPPQSINSVDQSIDIVTMQFASASLEQR